MDSLISIFHIDVKILLAQIVNFGIVFFVLYKFAFKPLAKVMQERTNKIEKSLEEAKEIEEKLSLTEQERKEILAQAKKDALAIVEEANKNAETNRQKTVEKTKEEIVLVIKAEKEKIKKEHDETFVELKKEMVDLVMLAVEKIIKEKLDSAKDKELIQSALNQKD
ncbi:MAG: F0F1 ATP synthase subunit B [Planctomycetes bacterium]|jgi:F-type H+-transporting ATPase subunit b|nr:F0F1 ATP synthase subunit B [Planctomycetota bacterium]